MQITHYDQAEQMATQVSGLVERSGVEIFVRKKLPDCIVMTLCHSQSVLHSEVGQCNHSGSSALISTKSSHHSNTTHIAGLNSDSADISFYL